MTPNVALELLDAPRPAAPRRRTRRRRRLPAIALDVDAVLERAEQAQYIVGTPAKKRDVLRAASASQRRVGVEARQQHQRAAVGEAGVHACTVWPNEWNSGSTHR